MQRKLSPMRKIDRGRTMPSLDTGLVQDNLPAQIIPGLFIGSIHAGFNQEGLNDLKITHILNASGMPATFPNSYTYFTVSVRDKEQANILNCVPASNIFIEAGMSMDGNVLVHCFGGRSRSAGLCIAFLMSSRSMTYNDALQMVRNARPVASVNRGFEEQLRAYGMMSYDIYRAQQYVLRNRIREVCALRKEHKSRVNNGKVNPKDPSPLVQFQKKISLPPKNERRSQTPCYIMNPLPSARLRLSRPRAGSMQIIPPLRGLERVFTCNGCSSALFTISNIIRTNMPVSDELDLAIKQSMTPLPAPSARSTPKAGASNRPNSGHMRSFSERLDQMSTLSVNEPLVPQSTKHSRQSNKAFSFGSSDFAALPLTTKHSSNGARKNNHTYWGSGPLEEGEDEDDDEGPTPLSSPMQIDGIAGKAHFSVSETDTNTGLSNGLPGRQPQRPKLPSLDHTSLVTELHSNADSPNSTSEPFQADSMARAPVVSRPQSVEKRRWLQKMLLLDSVEGQRAIEAASQDEEMGQVDPNSTSYYVEYLPWFGDILNEDSGPLTCPREGCCALLGEYCWTQGVDVPMRVADNSRKSSGSTGVGAPMDLEKGSSSQASPVNLDATTVVGPPRFEIRRAAVSEAPLDDQTLLTPRSMSMIDDESHVAISPAGAGLEGRLLMAGSGSGEGTPKSRTSLPQIKGKVSAGVNYVRGAISARVSARSSGPSSRQSSPKAAQAAPPQPSPPLVLPGGGACSSPRVPEESARQSSRSPTGGGGGQGAGGTPQMGNQGRGRKVKRGGGGLSILTSQSEL